VLFVIVQPGRSLKRPHRPNLLTHGYMGFKVKQGFRNLERFQPCLPESGPDEASEGIYPVTDKKKLGVGKESKP